MKRNLLTVGVLWLVVMAVVTSCLKDDSASTTTDEAAITAFSMGTLKRTYHSTTSSGADTVYTSSVTGSLYSFHIDQLGGVIYNVDSLPVGTDVSRCPLSITTVNSGALYIRSLVNDSLVRYYSTDSVDFTSPRVFRVMSSSGKAYRDYTVRVGLHQEDADTFSWHAKTAVPLIASMTEMHAVEHGFEKYLFGMVDGSVRVLRMTNGTDWTTLMPNVELDNCYVVDHRDALYVTTGGKLYRSDDGSSWSVVGSSVKLDRLLGAGNGELYALGDGVFYCSDDGGHSWEAEVTSDDLNYLPSSDFSCVFTESIVNDSTESVVLAGSRDSYIFPYDTTSVVWYKLVEYGEGSPHHDWKFVSSYSDYKHYRLPRLKNLTMVNYNERIVAFGGESIGPASIKPFAKFWTSEDYGLTWEVDTSIKFPKSFSSSSTSFAAVSDSFGYIWIFCGGTGQVWCVYRNENAWKEVVSVYTE